MDIRKTALEIGLFETAKNLEKAGITDYDGNSIPLPAPDVCGGISKAAEWLCSFGKNKYMFLTPEIALIEEIADITENAEAIIAVPCGIDTEIAERLSNNLPVKMCVSIINEPYFPENFTPQDGIIVVCGYRSGGRNVVMNETYRLAEHYSGFYGKKVFVPYVSLENFCCPYGWKQSAQIFDGILEGLSNE